MRVLVTGGAGYIGSHTVIQLIAAGHDVLIVDSFANSKPTVISRLESITGKHLQIHAFDLRDADQTEGLFARQRVDAVIHFAGHKAVGESVQKPLEYYKNNLDSTLVLAGAMERHAVTKLVFSSSATVYGASAPVPMTEDLPTSATNPYGWTKVMIEQILRDVAVAQPEWRIALLRYYNHVEDLAAGHIAALSKLATTDSPVSTWNLGTGVGTSVLDVLHAFERAVGRALPYEIVARRAGDIAASYADPHRANAELGWTATRTIDNMCADSWRWQSQNPDGYPDA